ncbi:hypothetical protein ACNQGL_15810 [Flavobacterium sp. LB3P21]|uniref:hypothetical protein n=1 Tax=Flavobacterium sp. LB3P21 TaxID=3401719 RepID=UPI003AAC1512
MADKITDIIKIRKAIKFYCNGKSKLFISKHLSLSRNKLKKYISLFEVLGLIIEVINEKTDKELELLFSHTTVESISPKLQKLHDFFPKMERELKKIGVTIHHMWELYIAVNPYKYRSSQFYHH